MSMAVCPECGKGFDVSGCEPFTLTRCPECASEVIVPREMGFLKMEKPLGKKAFFEIYEGFDASKDMNSTIFVLDKNIPDYEFYRESVKKEAGAFSVFSHQNICPIINFGEIDGNFFVTEPRMDGYPLSDYLPEEHGLLDVEQVIEMFQAVALGMAAAHHKEFIHHNICPENIHIDARKNMRIKSFLVSRCAYHLSQKTNSSELRTSPWFISPEKAESGVEDKAGDIFAFGALFYFMLTGKYPFAGRTEAETIFSRVITKPAAADREIFSHSGHRFKKTGIEYVPPVPLHKLRGDVPEDISSIIMCMLSYYAVRRPKFTEIVNIINFHHVKKELRKIESVKDKMVIAKTDTKKIPFQKKT